MPLVARQFALLVAIGSCAGFAQLAAADRYEAWLADGTKLSTNYLPAWPQPGVAFRSENRDLLDSQNPLRLMRDRTLSVTRRAPYVVLANGDVLSGAPVGLEPTLGRATSLPKARIQLEPPLMPVVGTSLAVRTDRIARIVSTAEAARSEPPPGTVVLTDGRRLAARSVRWRDTGLAILTAEGIVEAAYGEIADAVFPVVDRQAAVLDDSLRARAYASASAEAAAIVRFQMTGGAVITSSRIRREIEQSRRRRLTTNVYYYVQPAWCDAPLALPEPTIAWCGYRRADEAPLSLLPATTLANERLIGKVEPWRTNAGGDLLSAGGRDSDLGIAAHAHSAIAFDLPEGAHTLELSAALDKTVGRGGCVQCLVLADDRGGKTLWDSGIFTGASGISESQPLGVVGLRRIVLETNYAHDGRPAGADPLDIRDQVVWLAPLVRVNLARITPGQRLSALVPGLADWERSGDGWQQTELDSRWNSVDRSWDLVSALPAGAELQLRRKVHVSRANDVLELLTACPRELDEHVFTLTVNGTEVDAVNNEDRRLLRSRVQNYGRDPTRDEWDERYSDRLAYWWDLSRWRGQEVQLELSLRGNKPNNEIAWRGLELRSAVANLPPGGPLKPAVQLTSLEPLDAGRRERGAALPNAIGGSRSGDPILPIRFLGQQFTGGYGLARDTSVTFPLKAEYARFVAIAGCCLQSAGPLQVLIDDRVVWERPLVSSLSPAEQIEIAIPAGSQTLTLHNGSEGFFYSSSAAWAEAGFDRRP